MTKEIDNDIENIFKIIIIRHEKKRNIKFDKKIIKTISKTISKISTFQVLKALKILQTYEKQQKQKDATFTKALRRREKELYFYKNIELR